MINKLFKKLLAGFLLLQLLPLAVASAQSESRLVVAIPYPLEVIDPLAIDEPVNRLVLENAAGILVRAAEPGATTKDYPLLVAADGFSRLANGWQFTLPTSVQFSNGRVVTAADIVETFALYRSWVKSREVAREVQGGQEVLPAIKLALANLESVTADPKRRSVSFVLKQAGEGLQRDFLQLVATLPIFDPAVASLFAEEFGKGTQIAFIGPTLVTENRPDDGVQLRRTIAYANTDGGQSSYRKLVVLRYYKSAEIALRKLRAGVVDIILTPTAGLIEAVELDPVVTTSSSPLENLKAVATQSPYSWRLRQNYWSIPDSEGDRLQTETIVHRRGLIFDSAARQRFALWGVEKH